MMRKTLFLLAILLAFGVGASANNFTPFVAYGDAWKAQNDTYTMIMWNATGNHTFVTTGNASTVNMLLVGGGGGGGGKFYSGGGGAGGFLYCASVSVSGTKTVAVGTGGLGATVSTSPGANGGDTFFDTLVAKGGGGGRSASGGVLPGGSGAGGNGDSGVTLFSNGTLNQGNDGGRGWNNAGDASLRGGGGGGGAGLAGQNGASGQGGYGGTGIQNNITGNLTWYAAGGGGGNYNNPSNGGSGIGGAGASGASTGGQGLNQTGSGGGGAGNNGNGGNGGSGIVIISFITSSAPTPSFTGAPLTGHAPLSVTFTDASTGSPDSWNWTFGDGYVDNVNASPVHMYLTAGTYSVNLSVGNAGGNNSLVKTNYVTVGNASELYPSFNVNISTGNKPLNVLFTNTSSNYNASLYSLFWQFGDGNTSTAANPTFTYNVPGTYLANLTLTNNTAATNTSASQTITVTIPTGFTQQDLVLTPSYILTLSIRDSTTGILIPSAAIVDNLGNTYTTSNGTFYLTYPYSTVVLTVMSTGYTTKSVSYIIDSSQSQTVQLVPETPAASQNTWYSPHQVRFKILDSYGAPLSLLPVNATAVANTLPSNGDLQNMYGINPTAANEMLNNTLIMQGTTGNDGAIVFTMLGSIGYNLNMTNPVRGGAFSTYVMPIDSQYNIWVNTSTLPGTNPQDSVYLAVQNTSLWFSEPNVSYIRLGINYTDTSGKTTQVNWFIKTGNNNTVVYTKDLGNPGTGMVTDYRDFYNKKGYTLIWNYSAVRST